MVPPPPEKQAVGRFDQNFVESRRAALERMLNKIAAHPVLQHDGDLKLFLESEAFNVDIKHKERKDVGLPEAKSGMFGGMLSVGGGSKFIEHDDVRFVFASTNLLFTLANMPTSGSMTVKSTSTHSKTSSRRSSNLQTQSSRNVKLFPIHATILALLSTPSLS